MTPPPRASRRTSLAACWPVAIITAMKKLEMTISGMHCESCVAKVRDALATITGVQNSDVQVGSATVTFDDGQCGPKPLLNAVRGAGFQLGGFKTMDAET